MHKHKWSWVVKYAPTWFGKHGFNPPKGLEEKITEINVGELEEKIDEWLSRGLAEREGDKIVIDLAKIGYSKLLGRGRITRLVKVYVPYATELAVKKIEKIGGEVVKTRG